MDEEKKTGCTRHCENCNITQRCYCAAQISLYNQEEIATIRETQAKILSALESLGTNGNDVCTIHSQGSVTTSLNDTEE